SRRTSSKLHAVATCQWDWTWASPAGSANGDAWRTVQSPLTSCSTGNTAAGVSGGSSNRRTTSASVTSLSTTWTSFPRDTRVRDRVGSSPAVTSSTTKPKSAVDTENSG